MACGHPILCAVAPVSVSNSAFEEVFGDILRTSKVTQSPESFPSKVTKLITDLKRHPQDVKRYVVDHFCCMIHTQLITKASYSLLGD
jgi:hypothetical protein